MWDIVSSMSSKKNHYLLQGNRRPEHCLCGSLTMTLQLLPGAAKMMNAMQGNNEELKNIRGSACGAQTLGLAFSNLKLCTIFQQWHLHS